jgi:mono/diheme cytochrome c family protein
MISPPRETKTRNNNDNMAMGGVWRNSVNPYPLNDKWYLVGYRNVTKEDAFGSVSTDKYKIYLRNVDGKQQELLAWGDGSFHTPVVVAPWKAIWGQEPVKLADQTNFKDSTASFTMNDVYFGAGMKGIDKKSGVAKSLRVIALRYRISGACDQGYGAMVSGAPPSGIVFSAPTINPVSTGGCSWEAKEVLGETKIYEDGSAAFEVPARVPLYFEVLDSNGCMIAGMRSWSTLMPGEKFPCYGCPENKKEAPPVPGSFIAGTMGVKKLEKPLGIEGKPFDYTKMVEPIIAKNCASCHTSGHKSGFDLTAGTTTIGKKSFAKSYANLTKGLKGSNVAGVGVTASNNAVCITSIYSQPPQMPPRSYGSTKSKMIQNLLKGHNDVKLTAQELKILACWIDLECPHSGTYDGYMTSSDASKYQSLESTAKKWYDIELKNSKDWGIAQSTAIMRKGYSPVRDIAFTENFNIGYLPAERSIVLKNSCQGNLVLVDLRGRVVTRINLSDLHTSGDATVSLPASLSTGLYMARFEGVNGIQQAKITVTK